LVLISNDSKSTKPLKLNVSNHLFNNVQHKNTNQNHILLQSERLLIIKKAATNAGKDAGGKEPLYLIGGNVHQSSYYGNQYGGTEFSQKKKKIE
jgi:hypothetical protein